MSRTHKDHKDYWCPFWERGHSLLRWHTPGLGKFWKRQLNKAQRSVARGTGGRERFVVRRAREVSCKLW